MTWGVVLLLAAGTYALRLAGPLLRSRITMPTAIERYCSLGAVVLLAALVATAAFVEGAHVAGVARPVAVAVGGILAVRRAPFVVVVAVAALTAAALRLAGVP